MIRPIALAVALCATFTVGAQAPAPQAAAAPLLARDDIAALARIHVAVGAVHDSIDVQLAMARNKKPEIQLQLRDKLRTQIADVLHHGGITDAEYRRRTYVISSDPASRKVFDSVVVVLIGAPLPGTYVAAAGGRGNTPVPPGAVGTHIGHVINSFGDTPGQQGLLTAALAEARTAAQHAQLAGRQPGNLDYMKTHAGHVLNALDPTIVAAGPGLQYGLRKAAIGVATHIELAAAAEGASTNVMTHAKHVSISARNTVTRVDLLIAVAQKVQAATSAAQAAALVSEMASLAEQLLAGADANGDGRVTIEVGESGLQHADDHLKLMLAGER